VLIVAIASCVTLFMVVSEHEVARPVGNATSTPDLTGQSIFTDGQYGLSIRYPAADTLDYTFATFYHLPANWRVNTLPDATGTPIVSVIGTRLQSDHSYPRYFDAEVRVGASNDPKEVARCETAAKDQNEQPLPDVVLGGTTFKAFSFEQAAMMQYLKGVSYRTVHEGNCFAIEKLETGSSYKDDPPSKADIPDSVLNADYAKLDAIVQTFSFARP
jgi:hypothetical protein